MTMLSALCTLEYIIDNTLQIKIYKLLVIHIYISKFDMFCSMMFENPTGHYRLEVTV